jgi:hypothetical protein
MMNGGAWVEVDGQRIDLHLRDLETIDSLRVEAAVGRFAVYRSQYFIAGIPSYVPLAEIGTGSLLSGELPTVDFPHALRRSASEWWLREADRISSLLASLYSAHPHLMRRRAAAGTGQELTHVPDAAGPD